MRDHQQGSHWLIGIAISFAFWGIALLGFFGTSAPPLLFGVFAWPVTYVGWLALWGDNGPPFAWMESLVFIIASTVLIYAALGAIIGALLPRKETPPES